MNKNVTSSSSMVNEHSCDCTCLHFIIRLERPAEGAHFVINVIVSVLTIFTFVSGCALNTLVLIAYRKNRQLQTLSNFPLTILAVTDLAVCATVQPVFIVRSLAENYITFSCFLWATCRLVINYGFGVSLTTIALISVERFISLAFPFRHREIVTKTRLKVIFALSSIASWLNICAQSLAPETKIKTAIVSIVIITCLSLITGTWLWIYRLTKRHRRQINAMNTSSNFAKMMRNAKTCHLVVGSSMVCFLPTLISLVLHLIVRSELYFIHTRISPFCHVFLNINSLLNPLILLYRKRDFKETVKQFLLSKK